MSRDLKIALVVFLSSFVIFTVVALFLGPNVQVNSSVIQHGHNSGRYMLQVDMDEEENIARFTVVDTREGYSYVFNRDEAEEIIPPANAPGDTDESSAQE